MILVSASKHPIKLHNTLWEQTTHSFHLMFNLAIIFLIMQPANCLLTNWFIGWLFELYYPHKHTQNDLEMAGRLEINSYG